ncbi:MAG TPA: hypothetical protein VKJ65_13225 [Phycisphaerae bacterium]|nr:hypothetical protein [Phycisphaerae bacterium]
MKEIEGVPKDWPIFGVGRMAFNALAFLFNDRAVIGVPHPTGSFGHFNELRKDPDTKRKFITACKEKFACWLAE